MTLYYREIESGDYVEVDRSTNAYYRAQGRDHFQARCTAIAKEIGSVSTCGVSREWLRKKCRRVAKAKVPTKWMRAFG